MDTDVIYAERYCRTNDGRTSNWKSWHFILSLSSDFVLINLFLVIIIIVVIIIIIIIKFNSVDILLLQIELSSSWKKVDVVSRDYFDTLQFDGRPRSASSYDAADEQAAGDANQLSPSAPPFRPRATTSPIEHLSKSLPSSPSPSKRPKGSRTPKYLKDNKVAPRFYPAISKENVRDDGLVSRMVYVKINLIPSSLISLGCDAAGKTISDFGYEVGGNIVQ